jgi:alpha-mannosidase
MTSNNEFQYLRMENYLNLIKRMIRKDSTNLTGIQVVDPATSCYASPPDNADWRNMPDDNVWGSDNGWVYLRGSAAVPAEWNDGGPIDLVVVSQSVYHHELAMSITGVAGPEGQVFVNGERVGAIDTYHQILRYPFTSNKTYDVTAVFFAGQLPCSHILNNFSLNRTDGATEKLYHDLRVLLEVTRLLPETSIERMPRMEALKKTIDAIDFREVDEIRDPLPRKPHSACKAFYESIDGAQQVLNRSLNSIPLLDKGPHVVAMGHGHIDLGWLWPIAQTHHKCIRTFATQCRLLEQYDRWVYNQSSPQAYAWVEKDAPDLFEKIRNQVKAGRWEADGAMWVEADTNITGGESLVRQLLYGKRYFREKFGVDSRMLWLPDVFGYTACLPQLMKLADVDVFVTSKISWSQYNEFPYDTFRWRGLDGSEIPTHFITTPLAPRLCKEWDLPNTTIRTYNSLMDMEEIKGCWDVYKQKETGLDPLLTFGYGDGGGGPTEEMLETALRMADQPVTTSVTRVKLESSADLRKRIQECADRLDVWDGELYLEYHRGTYTTQGWLKRANRKNEVRLHNLDWLASLTGGLQESEKATLDQIWEDLLLCQFHDILPGSSIAPLYDEVRAIQDNIKKKAEAIIDRHTHLLCKEIDTSVYSEPVVIFNTLGWQRSEPAQLPDGSWRDDIAVPPGGWVVIDAATRPGASEPISVSEDGRTLTNRFWKIRLNEQGQLSELYDRKNDRQVLATGCAGNVWQRFEDRPLAPIHDAWDIDLHYEESPLPPPEIASFEVTETSSVRTVVELRWDIDPANEGKQSKISQRLILYANIPRIDFETQVDWYEHHQLLKVAFPVNIRATEATYQVQFGHVRRPTHRNNSWDLARFEVCAQQFADLSEHDYGVALINDCKYGHDIHEGVIRLTCIKSAQNPDPQADQGHHRFTYALLPHAGSFQEAHVSRHAAELNTPLIVKSVASDKGTRPCEFALFQCDNEAVVVETLKPAEDGNGVILRCYESHGSRGRVTLTFTKDWTHVSEVNLLEDPSDNGTDLKHEGSDVQFNIRPFQIVTLRMLANS